MGKLLSSIKKQCLKHPRSPHIGSVLLFCLAPPCFAQNAEAGGHDNLLLGIIVSLLVVQTLLILGLQRSRVNFKRAQESLKASQKALEERVIERTNKLRAINNQLYEEIAKHEITEELLQETQDYLHSMINSMPSVLIGVTREGTITQWNTAAERMTGMVANDALGKSILDVRIGFGADLATIQSAIDQGVTQVKEGIQQDDPAQGSYADLIIYPLVSDEVTGAVIRIDDVTMRVRFENMMIQNEKMMSLGELAAGMAHEINNPLSAILHGVQNIHRRTSDTLEANHETAQKHGITVKQIQSYLDDRGIYKFIDGIKDAGERAARIVTNMLEFSRASSRKHSPINIHDLIEHSLELAANSFDLKTPSGAKELEIRKEYQKDLPMVPCSAAEIQQVLLNIFRNAAQAFVGEGALSTREPRITIKVFTEGKEIKISIGDNGPGMSEAVKRHVFEPFFTTKEVGKGTGLGLSVSYFIVTEHHHGRIDVESTLGKGTTFTIALPLSRNSSEESHTLARSAH